MDFVTFARANGVLIGRLYDDDRVHRVPTTEHPRSRNGAYRFDGEWGWVQAWDQHATPIIYRPARTDSRPVAAPRPVRRHDDAAERARAAQRAAEVVARCRYDVHPYLERKGFPTAQGLIDGDGRLVIPMRPLGAYERVASVQWIDASGEKRFLPGGTAKGSVFKVGAGAEFWLVEGYATALSVRAALERLYRRATVVVCFSAGNLQHVAQLLGGRRFVVADNDASGTGQRAAQATGLPWVMPQQVGQDANDLHQASGLDALVGLMRRALG